MQDMTSIYGTDAPSRPILGVELPPSKLFGPLFACLDDKDALKKQPHIAFREAIFEACTNTDERNAYIVKRLRECLAPEAFQAWETERRHRTARQLAKQKQPAKKLAPQSSLTNLAEHQQPKEQVAQEQGTWMDSLPRDKSGDLKPTLHTVSEIFRHYYKGRVTWDEMKKISCFDSEPVTTVRLTKLREEIEIAFHCKPGTETTVHAFDSVAFENRFHPVREYLQSLPEWDATPRWEQLPKQAIPSKGKLDDVYWRKWAISAVARVLQPGCKVDTALILSGVQGLLKSSAFKELIGKQYFSDSSADIEGKEWVQEFHSKWGIEWAELERVTTKKGADVVKAFLTKETDDYRPPYAVKTETWPRGFIIFGTTNKEEFLVDPSGSRRFWVIRATHETNIEQLSQWRDQLWAEALFYYQQGESWWLTREQEKERERSNAEYEERDVWEETIEPWLANKKSDFHSTEAILTQALGRPAKDHTPNDKKRIASIMQRLEWVRDHKQKDGVRQRGWKRANQPTPTQTETTPEAAAD